MLMTALLFIPSMTCLFWLALNVLVHKKNRTSKALGFLLAISGIALFVEAGLTCSDGNAMLSFLFAKQFFALMIIPAAFNYISSFSSDEDSPSYIQAFLAVPVSLLAAQIILLILSGQHVFIESLSDTAEFQTDKVAKLIHLCSFCLFYSILAVEALLFIVLTALKAAKGEHQIHITNTLAAVIIYAVLELSVIYVFPLWTKVIISVVLSCILFMLSYSALFHKETNHKPNPIADQAPAFIPEKTIDIHQSLAEEDSLRIRFEDLIVSEQLFLKQGIRLADIATMLDTNRTYVSKIVNNTYNMSFSDYINTLRIDYAEQYILHHRDAKQSDIAAACGFPNASAFNNVFKKITGVTPKIWLATKS